MNRIHIKEAEDPFGDNEATWTQGLIEVKAMP